MNDDCSRANDTSESWSQRFEEALWLRTIHKFDEAERRLRMLADETEDRDKKATCLLWIAEVNRLLHCSLPEYSRKLLKLSKEIVWVLYGGIDDRMQEPNRLLMRAFLLMAQAQTRLGDYQKAMWAITQAAGCTAEADAKALLEGMDLINLEMEADRVQEERDNKARALWNCPHHHFGPYECAEDKTCLGPSIEDLDRWSINFWGCSYGHHPDLCRYVSYCSGPCDPEKREHWDCLQDSLKVIEAR